MAISLTDHETNKFFAQSKKFSTLNYKDGVDDKTKYNVQNEDGEKNCFKAIYADD